MMILSSFQVKLFLFAIIALFTSGLYIMVITRNMIRKLLGIELITKAVTLLFIFTGYISGNINITQALVITVIIIEVVVVAIAAGIVLRLFRVQQSLSIRNLESEKG